jgi:MFS transporter, SP family, solute carrier family 2 (myo-inositol transporter), member 13
MGPMPWTINSEIYPIWARNFGTAAATATNWFCNLLVTVTFLLIFESIPKYGTVLPQSNL